MRDDRGASVPMCAPTESGLDARRDSMRVHNNAWKSQPRSLALIVLMTTGSYVAAGMGIRAALGRPLLSVYQIASACVFAAAFIVVAVVWSRRRAKVTAEYIAECRAHRVCASCGYLLQDLPLESDGCTVCPECGAAWRLERERDSSLGSVPERLP